MSNSIFGQKRGFSGADGTARFAGQFHKNLGKIYSRKAKRIVFWVGDCQTSRFRKIGRQTSNLIDFLKSQFGQLSKCPLNYSLFHFI